MASFEYAIATLTPGATSENEVPGVWDHATATAWAHVEGRKLPHGTARLLGHGLCLSEHK